MKQVRKIDPAHWDHHDGLETTLDYLLDPVTGSPAHGMKVHGVVVLYVDDLFMADFEDTAAELRSMLLELVSLLGLTLEETKTPEPSDSLEILGVVVHLSYISVSNGFTLHASLTVGSAKRAFWGTLIQQALVSPTMPYKDFEKLTGRLVFGASRWVVF